MNRLAVAPERARNGTLRAESDRDTRSGLFGRLGRRLRQGIGPTGAEGSALGTASLAAGGHLTIELHPLLLGQDGPELLL
ncbi:MAG: hypothetical protein E4H37_02380, partial [Gemmatimonadales bacterium]